MPDRRPPPMYLIDVLETLGVALALDWDDELQVTLPLVAPTHADLTKIIEHQRSHLLQAMQTRRTRALKVFVGGPFNGKRHGLYDAIPHRTRPIRFQRGKWAVYQATEKPWADPRLHFLGYASSEAKARRHILLPKSAEGKS